MNKKLIVGLGNYTSEYRNTRHNVGFDAVDSLCESLNCGLSYEMFNGLFGKVIIKNVEYFIAKPLTFMNLSGEFVSQISNYLKINVNDIVVICDDVNINLGKLRIRKSGSSGGQKGLKNIIEKLKSEDFTRIRIGIGKPNNKKISLADYVLSKFSRDEKPIIKQTIDTATNILIEYLNHNNLDELMNRYN